MCYKDGRGERVAGKKRRVEDVGCSDSAISNIGYVHAFKLKPQKTWIVLRLL